VEIVVEVFVLDAGAGEVLVMGCLETRTEVSGFNWIRLLAVEEIAESWFANRRLTEQF
jgi:hypothetical protein